MYESMFQNVEGLTEDERQQLQQHLQESTEKFLNSKKRKTFQNHQKRLFQEYARESARLPRGHNHQRAELKAKFEKRGLDSSYCYDAFEKTGELNRWLAGDFSEGNADE